MKISFFCILSFFCSTAAIAGGKTGNGGGVIFCRGRAPVVHDYFELLQSGKTPMKLEGMTRAKFFQKAADRLDRSRKSRANSGLSNIPALTGEMLLDRVRRLKPLNRWPATLPWRSFDEAIQGDLPEGCEFKQGALYRDGQSYKIEEVTNQLSVEQSWVLELHEAIYSLADDGRIGMRHYTSEITRKYVGALIRKRYSYSSLNLLGNAFTRPDLSWAWRASLFDGVKADSDDLLPLNALRGVFALDLRSLSELEAMQKQRVCPLLIAFAQTFSGALSVFSWSERVSGATVLRDYRMGVGIQESARFRSSGTIGKDDQGTYFRFVYGSKITRGNDEDWIIRFRLREYQKATDLQITRTAETETEACSYVSTMYAGNESPEDSLLGLTFEKKRTSIFASSWKEEVEEVRKFVQFAVEATNGISSEFTEKVHELAHRMKWRMVFGR